MEFSCSPCFTDGKDEWSLQRRRIAPSQGMTQSYRQPLISSTLFPPVAKADLSCRIRDHQPKHVAQMIHQAFCGRSPNLLSFLLLMIKNDVSSERQNPGKRGSLFLISHSLGGGIRKIFLYARPPPTLISAYLFARS